MKKNFLKIGALLTLATALLVGVTSCVSDDVATEVRGIYEGQAEWIKAKTQLVLAETEYKNAETAYKKAEAEQQQVLADIAKATQQAQIEADLTNLQAQAEANKATLLANKQALEIAQLRYDLEIFMAKKQAEKEMNDEKWNQVNDYFMEYLSETGVVLAKTAQKVAKENALAQKNLELANAMLFGITSDVYSGTNTIEYFQKQVALKQAAKAAAEADKMAAENKLQAFKNYMDDANSFANQSLVLGDEIKALETEKDKKDAEIAKIDGELANDFADYAALNAAKDLVKTAQASVTTAEEAKEGFNEGLEDVGLANATTMDDYHNLHAQLVTDVATAETASATAHQELTAAEADFTAAHSMTLEIQEEYDNLNARFASATAEYADTAAALQSGTDNINAAAASKTEAQTAYDAAKADFEADPTGQGWDDGADDQLGIKNDNKDKTFMLVTWDATANGGAGAPKLTAPKIAANDFNELLTATGFTATNCTITTSWTTETAASLASVTYWDVEDDDSAGLTYEQILNDAEAALNAATVLHNQLVASSTTWQSDFDAAEARYNYLHGLVTTRDADLTAAQADEAAKLATKNAKQDAYDAAVTAANDAAAKVTALEGQEDNFYKKVIKLAEYDQQIVEAKKVEAKAQAEYDALKDKIDPAVITAYGDKLAEKHALELAKIDLDAQINSKNNLVTYYNELVKINKTDGSVAIADMKQWVADQIDDLEAALQTATTDLENAEVALKDAQDDVERAQKGLPVETEAKLATLRNEIAALEAQIETLRRHIAAAQAKADKYKALYEAALASIN